MRKSNIFTLNNFIGISMFMSLSSLLIRGSFFSALFNGVLVLVLLISIHRNNQKVNFKELIILTIPFFLTVFGLFLSYDKTEALEVIFRSITLFLVPFLYLKTNYDALKRGFFLIEKYLPPLTLIVFSFYVGIGYYISTKGLGDFLYYSNFSVLTDIHPTYSGCIVNLALILWLQNTKNALRIYSIAVVLAFIIILFIIGSKASILIAFLTTLYYLIITEGKPIKKILLFLIPLMFLVLFRPYIENRLSDKKLEANEKVNTINLIKNLVKNDIKPRALIWESNIKSLKGAQMAFGKGTVANDFDKLEEYRKNNLNYALKNNYNAHNQFVEVYYHYGVIGLALFLFQCIFFIRMIIRAKEWNYFLIFSFFMFYFLIESLLVRSFGIILYTFVISYIYINIKNAKSKSI